MVDEVKKENVNLKEDKEVQEGKVWAILAYLGILCLLPLLLKKENKFALHHGKQGLILFIAEMTALFVNVIPVIGQIVFGVVYLTAGIFSIIGIVKVLMGEYWKAPLISDIANKIKI